MSNTDELMVLAGACHAMSDASDDVAYQESRDALEVAIASLQARLDAAEADAALWRAHVSYAADGHSHLCRRCGHAYTPAGNEDCPKCGHDGSAL